MNQFPLQSVHVSCRQALNALEAFINAWQAQQQPPEIAVFLTDSSDQPLQLLQELIKIDLEYRYRVYNFPKRLDEYVAEFTSLVPLPVELIYEEFYFRQQSGLQVDPAEYLARYPEQALALAQFLTVVPRSDLSFVNYWLGAPPWQQVHAGDTLDDFQLLTELGQGAFARVFKARQVSMQRVVAVKLSENRGSEPQTLAQLDHPHLVRVYDQRILDDPALRLLYMEYVPGGTLAELMTAARLQPAEALGHDTVRQTVSAALRAKEEWLPELNWEPRDWANTVAHIGARLAEALDYAHAQGILHLDIKPANVLLDAQGQPKLADFNISFQCNPAGAMGEQHTGGSLAYMAPEQLAVFEPDQPRAVETLDGKSDVYALALTLIELLTLKRVFSLEANKKNAAHTEAAAPDFAAALKTMQAQRQQPPQPQPVQANGAELLAILQTCLQADPAQRPSAAQLARRLRLWLNPEAYRLFYAHAHPPKAGTAVLILLLCALVPNLLAAGFNYYYNQTEIIAPLPELARSVFWRLQGLINAVAFPLGMAWFLGMCGSLIRWLKQVRSDPCPAAVPIRCIHLGHHCALINIVLWTCAGVAYPLALHVTAGAMPLPDYPHFFASLLLCGIITSAYPFFLITAFCVRRICPQVLLRLSNCTLASEHLKRVKTRSDVYLGLAALVPLFTILTLVLIEPASKVALVIFCAASLLGLGLIISLFRRLTADLSALEASLAVLFKR